MHNKGNILNLVFTELDLKITITGYRTNTQLSDHYSIIIDTDIKKNKPNIVMKTIKDTTKISPIHLMGAHTHPYLNLRTPLIKHKINSRKNCSKCWMLWLHKKSSK